VFDWLLKQGADLDATNDAGETPRVLSAYSVATSRLFGPTDAESDIFLAVRQAKLDSATRLLAADRKLANLTNRDGQTPLRAAVLAQRTNMIELLEKNGAQWDEVSAVVAGRADALREILRQRPAAVSTMLSGASLLDLAADHGEVEIIKTLLASNADVRALDWSYRSPVGHALLAKRTDIAELLIQHGAKETLFDAVYADDLKTASALIAQDNTLFSATNGFGALVVQAAVARGHTDILEFLLNQGAPADGGKVLRLGKTPLHLAAISNQTNIAQLLIKHGAKVEAYDNSGFTPLHCAAWQGSSEVAALLLKNKANPDTGVIPSNPVLPTPMMRPDQSLVGDTALHLAAINGQTNLVQILLKSGASINAANSAGRTALDLASQPGVPQECVSITRSMSGTPPKNYAASLIERRKAAAAMLEASGGKHSGQSQAIPSRPVPGPPPRP
jgi:ankyrin repeat protein